MISGEMRLRFSVLLLIPLLMGCGNRAAEPAPPAGEDLEAKAMVQGIWVDKETGASFFKIEGDTVRYADASGQASIFRIIADTMLIGSSDVGYAIVRLTPNNFSFLNTNGDTIHLERSQEIEDSMAFADAEPRILSLSEVEKRDTVVMFAGERYHCYIAVNPTKIRVVRPTCNDDGIMVDNIYYDNIIHISVFKGKERLFSSDIKREMFAHLVPSQILEQSVLGNMKFVRADNRGFHFHTTICIPDGISCYLLDTFISFDGKLGIDLLEY